MKLKRFFVLFSLSSASILISILFSSISLNAATLSPASGEFYKITETNLGGHADASSQFAIEHEGALYSWAFSVALGQNGVSAGYKYDLSKFLRDNKLPHGRYRLNIKYKRGYVNPKVGFVWHNDFNMIKIIMAINGQPFNQEPLAKVNWVNFGTTLLANEISVFTGGFASAAKDIKSAQELLDLCELYGQVEQAGKIIGILSEAKQLYDNLISISDEDKEQELNQEVTIGGATELNLFSMVNTVSAGLGINVALCFLKIDEINLTFIEPSYAVDVTIQNSDQIPWINNFSINRATTNEIQPVIEIQNSVKEITPVEFKLSLISQEDPYPIVWNSHKTINTDINGYLQYIPEKILLNNEGIYGFNYTVLANNIEVSKSTGIIRDTIKPEIAISDECSGSYHITVSDNIEIARGVISFIDLYGTAGQEEKYEFFSLRQWEKDFAIGNYSGMEVTAFDNAGNSATKVVLKTPKIIVATPINAEINKELNITWDYEGFIGNYVKIEISRNGGSSWTTLSDSTDNDRSFPWIVSGETSADCLISITSTTNSNVTDISDGFFSIIAACSGHDLKVDYVNASPASIKPSMTTDISAKVSNKKSVSENNVNVTLNVSGPNNYSCTQIKQLSTMTGTGIEIVSFKWPTGCTQPSADTIYTATISAASSLGCDETMADNYDSIAVYVYSSGSAPPVSAYSFKKYTIKIHESVTVGSKTFTFVDPGVSSDEYALDITGQGSQGYEKTEFYSDVNNEYIWWYNTYSILGGIESLHLTIGQADNSKGFNEFKISVAQGETVTFTSSTSYDESLTYKVSGDPTKGISLDLSATPNPYGSYSSSGNDILVNTSGLSAGSYKFAILSGKPSYSEENYLTAGQYDVTAPIYILNIQKGTYGSGQIKINDGQALDLPCTQTFTSGSLVKIEAVATEVNSAFVKWTEDIDTITNPYTFTITGNKNITANFKTIYTLTIDKTGSGSGQIKVNNSEVSLPYTGIFDADTVVNLEAIEGSGSSFVEWTGGQSGNNKTTTITMSGNKTLSANFLLIRALTAHISPLNSGFIMADGIPLNEGQTKQYLDGQSANLTAIKLSGYNFTNWSGDAETGADVNAIIVMNGDKSATATFTVEQPLKVTLTVNKSGSGTGTVTVSSGSLTWSGTAGTATYDYGTLVTLTAIPDAGSSFTGWSGACSGVGTCSITMDIAKTVTAAFVTNTLNTPSLSSPADNATDQSTTMTLTWTDTNTSPQETGYQVHWKMDGAASYTERNVLGAGTTSDTLSGLEPGKKYWWSARAVGDGITTTNSNYSQDQSFTVKDTSDSLLLSISANPESLPFCSNPSSQITAILTNNGTAVQSREIAFAILSGNGYLYPASATTNAEGKATVIFTPSGTGRATIGAVVNGLPVAQTNVTITSCAANITVSLSLDQCTTKSSSYRIEAKIVDATTSENLQNKPVEINVKKPDGALIGSLYEWDKGTTGNPVYTETDNYGEAVAFLQVTETGEIVISVKYEGTTKTIPAHVDAGCQPPVNIQPFTSIGPFDGVYNNYRLPNAMSVSPDGKKIAVVSLRQILIYNVESWKKTGEWSIWHFLKQPYSTPTEAYAVVWSPDGKYIAGGFATSSTHSVDRPGLMVWNVGDTPASYTEKFRAMTDWNTFNDVWSIAWSPDSAQIMTGERYSSTYIKGGVARTWNLSGTNTWTSPRQAFHAQAVAWSAANYKAIGFDTGSAWIYNTANTRTADIITFSNEQVEALAWNKNGDRLVVGVDASGAHSPIYVYDVNGIQKSNFTEHSKTVEDLDWNSVTERLASCGLSEFIKVWDSSGTNLYSFSSLAGYFNAKWSPDGQILFARSQGGIDVFAPNDNIGPTIVADEPVAGFRTALSNVAFKGFILDPHLVNTATITINNDTAQNLPLGADGRFEFTVSLREGENTIKIDSVDGCGNASSVSRIVTRNALNPDFGIFITPTTQTAGIPGSVTYSIQLLSYDGFNAPVTLSVTGIPVGVTHGFSTNPVTPPANTVLTLNISTSAQSGSHDIVIRGIGDGQDHQRTIQLDVQATTGTININPDPNSINAPWTLTGYGACNGTGTGDLTFTNCPPGGYTLTWGNVAGWNKPFSETKTLLPGGTIILNGIYMVPSALVIPTLLSPADNATNQPTTMTVQWQDTNTSPQESSYKVRIKPEGGSYTEYSAAQNVTSYAPPRIQAGTKYYWSVKAVGNGTSTLDSAYPTDRSFTVSKASQTITFPAIPAKTYGAADFDPGATASSGLAVSYTSSNTAVATIVSGKIHIVGAGTSTITASQGGDSNWQAATNIPQTLTVNKANLTITADNKSRGYNTANPTFTYTPSGFVNGDTASLLSGSPTITTTATTASAVGNYPITIAQGTLAAANYSFNLVNGTLTVGTASQTITFTTPASKVYGDTAITLSATASSSLPVNFALVSGPASLSGSTLTITGVGNIVVKATQAGNSNYSAATDVQSPIVVSAKAITITANNASRAYGAANPATPGFTAPGLVTGDAISGVTYTYAATANATAAVCTTHAITPSGAVFSSGTAANYAITYSDGTLTISRTELPGDLDSNGKVDLVDAIMAFQLTTGIQMAVPLYLENEIGGNNKIGMEDIVYILQKTAGIR